MNRPLLHLEAAPATDSFDALAAAELGHRHRNLIAVVQALANHALLRADSVADAHARLTTRLGHLARSHELLEIGRWDACDIRGVLTRTLHDDLGIDPAAVLTHGPELPIAPDQARWLSMAFYELATNALKYGALSRTGGFVALRWWRPGPATGRVRLEWRERGGPPIAQPVRQGFGTGLIRRSLTAALGGRASALISPAGIDWLVDGDPRPV